MRTGPFARPKSVWASTQNCVLPLNSVPDYTTLYRFLARLDPADVAPVLNEIVRRMPGGDKVLPR